MPHRKHKLADLKDLNRSVLINHLKTEEHKTKEAATTVATPQTSVTRYAYEFFSNISNLFLWFYHYTRSRFGSRYIYPAATPTNNSIYTLHNDESTTIALASDWASDTVESDAIADEIKKHDPHYTIHLGDTYFVGTQKEIQNNFKPGLGSWHYGSKGSFALPGNHEMYTRGIPYHRDLLPLMGIKNKNSNVADGQQTPFFALQNKYWNIIGLDTGYNSIGIPFFERIFHNCSFHPNLINWLKQQLHLDSDVHRIPVFLSHHQYFSAFDRSYSQPAKQLQNLIGHRKAIWFWGHEHLLAIYDEHALNDNVTVYGRLIGNGGMPVEHKKVINEKEARKIVFHDTRIRDQKNKLGHNGYVILEVDGNSLLCKYFDEEKLIFEENWENDNGVPKLKKQQSHL